MLVTVGSISSQGLITIADYLVPGREWINLADDAIKNLLVSIF
jgi:hypothetical protein